MSAGHFGQAGPVMSAGHFYFGQAGPVMSAGHFISSWTTFWKGWTQLSAGHFFYV